MFRLICTTLALMFVFASNAQATVIGSANFTSPTMIDFETAPNALIGSFYSGLGITFTNIEGGNTYSTGATPASRTGTNFTSGFANGELLFSSTMTRFGVDITTNNGDDTQIYAYLGSTLVGSEFFNTFGAGSNGSFAGVEFLSGFDRIVIDTFGPVNGAFGIDNLRFESNSVPEPGTLTLFGLGLLGFVAARRRKQ